jgi:hypothetical protein
MVRVELEWVSPEHEEGYLLLVRDDLEVDKGEQVEWATLMAMVLDVERYAGRLRIT